jgi:hypothetical protein
VQLFWKLLDLGDAKLTVDNDCCYITYDFPEDEDEDAKHQSFGFGPKDIAYIFGEKLNIDMAEV